MILDLVLHSLLTQMISRQRPRSIVSQYRALILTCKCFKIIIDHASPRVHMNMHALRYRIGHDIVYCPKIRLVNDQNIHEMEKEPVFDKRYFRQWSVIFKAYQKVSTRHVHCNNLDDKDYLDAVGKFWLNDRISLRDLRHIYRWGLCYLCDLLLIISPILQKRALPIEEPYGNIITRPGFEWCLHRNTTKMRRNVDLERVVSYAGTQWPTVPFIYSVRDWSVPGDPGLRGSLIVPKATEWWIWMWNGPHKQLEYALAYLDGNVWVFSFSNSKLYTNFKQTEKIGDFGDCVEFKGIFENGWVSRWPRTIEMLRKPSREGEGGNHK
jgi:hypothetical protein